MDFLRCGGRLEGLPVGGCFLPSSCLGSGREERRGRQAGALRSSGDVHCAAPSLRSLLPQFSAFDFVIFAARVEETPSRGLTGGSREERGRDVGALRFFPGRSSTGATRLRFRPSGKRAQEAQPSCKASSASDGGSRRGAWVLQAGGHDSQRGGRRKLPPLDFRELGLFALPDFEDWRVEDDVGVGHCQLAGLGERLDLVVAAE